MKTPDELLSFPVEKATVSAVSRTIIVDEMTIIDAAWTETDAPFIMKGRVENRDGWRHCIIGAVSDDKEADLD